MQQTVNGFSMWSVWQPDRNLFFNSHFMETADGNLVIDPLPLSEADAAEIERRGGAAWVVVTNRDHERATAAVVQRFGAKVACGSDASELSVRVDRVLAEGDEIGGAAVLAFDGLKTPGEIALWFPEKARTTLVGDSLWGDPAGSLRIMPKVADPERAARSLRKLLEHRPRHLLVGDGASIFGNAFEVLCRCFAARDDSRLSVINIDELPFQGDRHGEDPPGYRAEYAEIGQLLGATKLGYQAARLPAGESFCPMHWHTAEEELFIVWDGEPTLRTPRGTTRLRSGDFVAFPTGADGAHKVTNETDRPCTIIMIANEDEEGDACVYTDSGKVGVPGVGRVRTTPTLSYYDGEA